MNHARESRVANSRVGSDAITDRCPRCHADASRCGCSADQMAEYEWMVAVQSEASKETT